MDGYKSLCWFWFLPNLWKHPVAFMCLGDCKVWSPSPAVSPWDISHTDRADNCYSLPHWLLVLCFWFLEIYFISFELGYTFTKAIFLFHLGPLSFPPSNVVWCYFTLIPRMLCIFFFFALFCNMKSYWIHPLLTLFNF